MKKNESKLWDAALIAMKKLRRSGHVALLAGGCVRDRLLNRTPKDYDIVTDAVPDRICELFSRSRRVGAKFGVVLVNSSGHDFEIATFRADGRYSDGRRPDEVEFVAADKDARRRDFTINGLFYDPFEDEVIDYVAGRADIDAGLIRTIGDPDERFAEDHLRMLRAVRFSARLGFAIEEKTFAAVERLAGELRRISPERIWMELEQILTGAGRRMGWDLLVGTGLRAHLSNVWPTDDQDSGRSAHRVAALPTGSVAAPLALASVVCHHSQVTVKKICHSLRLSNQATQSTLFLTRSLPELRRFDELELADIKLLLANPGWSSLTDLLRADLRACGEPEELYDRVMAHAAAIPEDKVDPAPFVTGDDLCACGMKPGPRLGEVLDAVFRAQLNEQVHSRDEALKWARSLN